MVDSIFVFAAFCLSIDKEQPVPRMRLHTLNFRFPRAFGQIYFKILRFAGWASSFALGLLLITPLVSANNLTGSQLQALVSQKLMIDVRYYCSEAPANAVCKQPVLSLPSELEDLISRYPLAGVILFSENLHSTEQILTLNHSLQRTARLAGHLPLFIAVDQEGGRVVRLPEHLSTSFAGNMAIGATWQKHGVRFAVKTGEMIAKDLKRFGINLNFAPNMDVNVNPDNPVINVRSYSENPEIVAKLGTAQMHAMQRMGVIPALKHFPGHGDTNIDSHTGLPIVSHSTQVIEKVDLMPFRFAIKHGEPDMIMTAHIQYPALDNNRFIAKDGQATILPATMSRKILTGILRERLDFNGVIITDALDMAGIAHYFEHAEAVIQTFAAGTDIALMPYTIRTAADITEFEKMLSEVSRAIQDGRLSISELQMSVERINALKNRYSLEKFGKQNLTSLIQQAEQEIALNEAKALEKELAEQSIVILKGQSQLPIDSEHKLFHLYMPDQLRCLALTRSLNATRSGITTHCQSMAAKQWTKDESWSDKPDLVILGDISPQQSLAEMGGVDDIQTWRDRADPELQKNTLMALAQEYEQKNVPIVFVTLRTPYVQSEFSRLSQVQLASFSYNVKNKNVAGNQQGEVAGPIFDALAQVLLGKQSAQGRMPVSLQTMPTESAK